MQLFTLRAQYQKLICSQQTTDKQLTISLQETIV
jgi:hypothetical protein